jgi:hypothetical protein
MNIEKDIPIPDGPRNKKHADKKLGSKRIKYPFRDMQVGDSFFVDGESCEGKARSAATAFGRRWMVVFVCRKESTGIRIWRAE